MPDFGVRTRVLLTRSPLANAGRWPRNYTESTRNYAEKFCVILRLFCGILRSVPRTDTFDLHALSTPPAFILDQDQILNNCPNFKHEVRRNLVTIIRVPHHTALSTVISNSETDCKIPVPFIVVLYEERKGAIGAGLNCSQISAHPDFNLNLFCRNSWKATMLSAVQFSFQRSVPIGQSVIYRTFFQ